MRSRSPQKVIGGSQEDDESAYSSSSSVRSESPIGQSRSKVRRRPQSANNDDGFRPLTAQESAILHASRKAKIILIEDNDDKDEQVEVRIKVPSSSIDDYHKKEEEVPRIHKPVNERIKPLRPTTSFIRTRSASRGDRRSYKTDPVMLHQYYQRIWNKTKFPGDESSKDLRWRVREFMAQKS